MKAEERSRTFKEYLDKLKISHSEYESRNMSLEKVASDLQNKLARQRKEHRELGMHHVFLFIWIEKYITD